MTVLLFRDDSYARQCQARVIAVDARGITLDQTVFYPTGGGQPGDCGWLRFGGTEIAIVDTIKGDDADTVIHVPAPGAALPALNETVDAVIDWERRYRHMRMHTALHLLCAVVPGAVTGGQIGSERSRLDFNVPAENLDKDAITTAINQLIVADHPVQTRFISDAALAAQPDLVRTMSVKPPTGAGQVRLLEIIDTDLQPCGGTHVCHTGEIGPVTVVKIENKGKQNRRIILAFAS
ncbi:MAG: alanyl-tRNA editing protein [Azospirillaceae bacterium]|nr:alanyl-tRNA editing protein [Azospirillaceae bacterium]